MAFEKEIVLCILKLTKVVKELSIKDVVACSGFASTLVKKTVGKLRERDLIIIEGKKLLVNDEKRLRLACFAASLGCDVERISRFLTWREFEVFCSNILERCGFKSFLNFRFKLRTGRREVDVLGLRRPFILCIDAKQWGARFGKTSGLRNAIKKHVERVKLLGDVIDKYMLNLGIENWGEGVLVPLLVTLFQEKIMLEFNVPVVPIFKLNSFLMDFDGYLDELRFYKVTLPRQRKII